MMLTLPQHWSWDRSLSIPILAAVGVLVTILVGALRLRGHRRLAKQEKAAKPLFPRNRVFLAEKSSGAGCARPCATGPLFQFDAADTHESLELADTFHSHDASSGSDNVTLFVPNYERHYDQHGMPRGDFYAPVPEPAMQAWKQQQHQQHQHQQHQQQQHQQHQHQHELHQLHQPRQGPYADSDLLDGHYSQQQPMAHAAYYDHAEDPGLAYAYSHAVEFGEDDSDSGASLPSHHVESLELADAGRMDTICESAGGVGMQQPQQANPFASLPFVPGSSVPGMQQDADLDGLIMPYDRQLEPLDPTFALEPTAPRSLLSEGLRTTQHQEEGSHVKQNYVIDPDNLLYNAPMPLPLSNPSYAASEYPAHETNEQDVAPESLGFSHLNAADAGQFYYTPPQRPQEGAYTGAVVEPTAVPMAASPNARRRASLAAANQVLKSRDAPRRKAFTMRDSMDADFAGVAALSQSFASDALPGSQPPSLTANLSDVEVASSVGSSGVSPKSPKETDGSGDDSGPRYRCPHCDTTFRIRGYLTRHIKKHADVMMYNCPFFKADDEHRCHATGGFSRRDTYKTHLKARHFLYPRGTGRKDRFRMPGNCSGCGERFNNNEEWIETHIQTGNCSGQVAGSHGPTRTSVGLAADASAGSSPASEHDTDAHSEGCAETGPYHHDFEKHNMLITHVQ